MATIRHSLQKEVFDITEEKLVGILNVTKPGKKKKKTSFLCAAINKEKPVHAFIHQIKETDKDSFKKKNSWPLFELQVVDGKDENKETAELDLTIDRVYKWVASSVPEKQTFIHVLWKLCCRYLPKQKPQFINVPPELIKDDSDKNEGKVVITPGENFCVNSFAGSYYNNFMGVKVEHMCIEGFSLEFECKAFRENSYKKKKRRETVAEQIARSTCLLSNNNCGCENSSHCDAGIRSDALQSHHLDDKNNVHNSPMSFNSCNVDDIALSNNGNIAKEYAVQETDSDSVIIEEESDFGSEVSNDIYPNNNLNESSVVIDNAVVEKMKEVEQTSHNKIGVASQSSSRKDEVEVKFVEELNVDNTEISPESDEDERARKQSSLAQVKITSSSGWDSLEEADPRFQAHKIREQEEMEELMQDIYANPDDYYVGDTDKTVREDEIEDKFNEVFVLNGAEFSGSDWGESETKPKEKENKASGWDQDSWDEADPRSEARRIQDEADPRSEARRIQDEEEMEALMEDMYANPDNYYIGETGKTVREDWDDILYEQGYFDEYEAYEAELVYDYEQGSDDLGDFNVDWEVDWEDHLYWQHPVDNWNEVGELFEIEPLWEEDFLLGVRGRWLLSRRHG